jgi:hypothetical protein
MSIQQQVTIPADPAQVYAVLADADALVPDWVGTRLTFTMTAAADGCRLDFAHHGLVPTLVCFDRCAIDWGHFLFRLCDHVQRR